MKAQPRHFAAAHSLSMEAEDDLPEANDVDFEDLAGDELDLEDWSLDSWTIDHHPLDRQ